MGRGLKYEIPGEDPRVGVDEVTAEGALALYAGVLPRPFPFVVEFGFGRGEFLLELAAKEPNTAFLGVDVSFKRTLKLARKVAASGLANIRLVEARAQVVVQALTPASVRDVWINFSDPWPKARHARRRLFQREFVHDVACVLAPNGRLLVATDDAPYATAIDEILASERLLANRFSPEPWRRTAEDRIETGYEAEWVAAGRPLHFFEYFRAGDGEIARGGVVLRGPG